MNNPLHIRCSACGAVLDAEINREYIFCKYCGSKNRIENEAMRTNINVGNINIVAKTDLDNLLSSAKYLTGIRQFYKANEILMAVLISGCEDYRVHTCKATIDLHTNDVPSLLYSMEKLKTLEVGQQNKEVTQAIKDLSLCRGLKGFTALHIACLFRRYDLVAFFVKHGSDVNAVAEYDYCAHCGGAAPCNKHSEAGIGKTKVTPISILFADSYRDKFNITTNEDKENVRTIRKYLIQHGAKDKWQDRLRAL
jgi:ankyrin repeat protein